KKELEMLREVGFTESEIAQLNRLRRNYAENEVGHASVEHHDFTFVHWLTTRQRELQLHLLYWW
ncbi:MAG TPA: hypothetical protein VE843_17970, partial [Ktedonobacteraceae bacterium]|nr:hypothetical protein [Ktedonobacteraceae bacterium]